MWIHNFLSNRQQFVAVTGTASNEVQVRSDVPQGSVLGPLLFLIHISDINYEIADSADSTGIHVWRKDEEDTQMLQNYLHKLHKWVDTNNMKFNANKFELLQYGKEQEIKSATTYISYDDSNIDNKEQVRDLGIMMSNTATFTLHVRNIDKKARDKMGWVLRVFSHGSAFSWWHSSNLLSFPYSSTVSSSGNCVKQKHTVQAIEAIQLTFTYKITEVQHLNYWERLHELKLYSLQRRRESYIIIYIWKKNSIWCRILMAQWGTK